MKVLNVALASLALVVSANAFAGYFDLQVKKCMRVGEEKTTIQCDGIVRNSSAESSDDLIVPTLFLSGEFSGQENTKTRLYSYEGDAVNVAAIVFGANKTGTFDKSVSHRIPGKLPVKFSVFFNDAPKSIEAAARIDFLVRPDREQETMMSTVEDIAID